MDNVVKYFKEFEEEQKQKQKLNEVVSNDQIEDEMVNEMTRVRQKTSGLPMIIYVQPNKGESTGKHDGPRIKFQDNTNNKLIPSDLVPMSISQDNPKVLVKNYKTKLDTKVLQQLQKWIILNYDILMDYWNNIIYEDELIIGIKQYEEK